MTPLEAAVSMADRLNVDLSYAFLLGDSHLIELAARQYANARELVGVERGIAAGLAGIEQAFAGLGK